MKPIVTELRAKGAAKAALSGPMWDVLAEKVDVWLASSELQAYIDAYKADPPTKEEDDYHKYYIARWMPHSFETTTYEEDDPFVAAAISPTFLDVLREYFGGRQPRLEYYDVWHTFPMEVGRQRVGSQDWHSDKPGFGKDSRYAKIFLYFADCLHEGAGPMEIWSKQGPISCYAKRGDLWFVDTGGVLHRGGYSLTEPRTYAVFVYYDPAKTQPKPYYNLTPAARMKFDSPVLWTVDDWDAAKHE